MAYKALLVDFYGTLVREDDHIIRRITEAVCRVSPKAVTARQVASFWWDRFRLLCEASHGPAFRTQRDIELVSLKQVLAEFEADLDAEALTDEAFAYWVAPAVAESAQRFLKEVTLPICIVSNIDTADIEAAIRGLGWSFDGVVTSESCRAYKPRPEMFEAALTLLGLAPEEVLQIGDSVSADIRGAGSLGIDAVWVNRRQRNMRAGAEAGAIHTVSRIADVVPWLKGRAGA